MVVQITLVMAIATLAMASSLPPPTTTTPAEMSHRITKKLSTQTEQTTAMAVITMTTSLHQIVDKNTGNANKNNKIDNNYTGEKNNSLVVHNNTAINYDNGHNINVADYDSQTEGNHTGSNIIRTYLTSTRQTNQLTTTSNDENSMPNLQKQKEDNNKSNNANHNISSNSDEIYKEYEINDPVDALQAIARSRSLIALPIFENAKVNAQSAGQLAEKNILPSTIISSNSSNINNFLPNSVNEEDKSTANFLNNTNVTSTNDTVTMVEKHHEKHMISVNVTDTAAMPKAEHVNATAEVNLQTISMNTTVLSVITGTNTSLSNAVFTTTAIVNETRAFEFVRVNGYQIPHIFIFEKSCNSVLETGGCRCITQRATKHRVAQARCCCVGPQARQIPQNFSRDLTSIFFYNVGILEIREDDFSEFPRLEEIVIDSASELRNVEGGAFADLSHLNKISITNCQNLERWSTTLLEKNRKLRSLIARGNALTSVPLMRMANVEATAMELLDFSANRIVAVERGAFSNVSVLELRLQDNRLRRIDAGAFIGSHFRKISLNDNPDLQDLSLEAFEYIKSLIHLDLSNTRIKRLPVLGLKNIQQLTLRNVPTLKKLPPVLAFIHLNKAEFTYPYHCCFFKHASRQLHNKRYYEAHYDEIQRRLCLQRWKRNEGYSSASSKSADFEPESLKNTDNSQEIDDDYDNDTFAALAATTAIAESSTTFIDRLLSSSMLGRIFEHEDTDDNDDGEEMITTTTTIGVGKTTKIFADCQGDLVSEFYSNITCTPQPDALNPCEDIVSYYPLRCVIWVMWISGIIGNIAVWIVIAAVWKRQMRLHYFFMLNVSFADFLTGVYLAILAITDWKTSNEYYNYAVEWQTGWGCSAAGFISVFASQLSIFSMLLIAVEIYYNAKHAFYGRRMSSKVACLLMGLGYTYAFTMAILPLLGVSSYKHSSICLPLTINSRVDQAYILLGLSLSAVAFASMVANYALINCMIRNREMPSRDEDHQILRRTIVLIGTDMICWVPTLFLGITAALGMPLITLTNAKICLILFYPINSCANPLLYVFLTKIWKDAKRKAQPIFEIISSKSQNFSRHNNHNSICRNRIGWRGVQFGRGFGGHRRARSASRHARSHSDYIANFYYSAPPSPAVEENRRQSEGDFDNATKALLEDVRTRIALDGSSKKDSSNKFNNMKMSESPIKLSASTPALDTPSSTYNDAIVEASGITEIPVTTASLVCELKCSLEDNADSDSDPSLSTSSGTSLGIRALFDNTAATTTTIPPLTCRYVPLTTTADEDDVSLSTELSASAVRSRLSAVPEMSDISESPSNSCEHLYKVRPKRQKNGQRKTANDNCGSHSSFFLNLRLSSDSEQQQQTALLHSSTRYDSMSPPPVKRDSDTSIGRDSGRGDSLTSCVLNFTNRPSVASINWEDKQHQQ